MLLSTPPTSAADALPATSHSDASLSLAGPASLTSGSSPGLLLPPTSSSSQPTTPVTLGRPLPFLVPEVERGFTAKVHVPAAGAPEGHPGGRGASVRPSSTSSCPSPPQPERPSTSNKTKPSLRPPKKKKKSKQKKTLPPMGEKGFSRHPVAPADHQPTRGTWNVL